MKAESEMMPDAIVMAGGSALVRANIRTITRTDDGKARTVYQYDEVQIATVDATAADLADSAEALVDLAEVSDSGVAVIPVGERKALIQHRLGVVPESIVATPRTAAGIEVFVSSDAIIMVAQGRSMGPVTVDWAASGRGRLLRDREMRPVRLDTKMLSTVQVAYAAKMEAERAAVVEEPVELPVKGMVTRDE